MSGSRRKSARVLQAYIEHNVCCSREVLDRHARHFDIRLSKILQIETKPSQMDVFLWSAMTSKHMLACCLQIYLSA